jgi:hypothetical protein
MIRDEDDQELEALRFDWDEVYEIGVGLDGFWARRRDAVGETMIHEDPGQLRRRIREDYGARPRQALPGRPSGQSLPGLPYLPARVPQGLYSVPPCLRAAGQPQSRQRLIA